MDEADEIRVCREVLPRPIERRELAVVRIFHADVVARVISREAEIDVRVQCMADVHGQVTGLLRHPVRLVRRNHNSDVQKLSAPHMKSL